MTLPRVAYVIGTTTGGTGRHAAMLAEGCTARRLTVSVFGPAATRSLFPAVAFTPVDIADRPRPARDAAAVLLVIAAVVYVWFALSTLAIVAHTTFANNLIDSERPECHCKVGL